METNSVLEVLAGCGVKWWDAVLFVKNKNKDHLEVFKMWIWKKWIYQSQTWSNGSQIWSQVLDEVSECRKYITILEWRRTKFTGHNEFETNVIEGNILGKTGRGRPKKSIEGGYESSEVGKY